jgi:hypothetical protein
MFKDFCEGIFGEKLKLIKQLQRDLLKANNVNVSDDLENSFYYCSMCNFEFDSFLARF